MTIRQILGFTSLFAALLMATSVAATEMPKPPFKGVNLASAGFAGSKLPGRYKTHYIYPTVTDIDYFSAKGMNTFRLAFRWERLQHKAYDDFNWLELNRLKQFVADASQKQTYTILDVHNYARYYGEVIGSDALPISVFADFWSKLALEFKRNPWVIFGLMNEPHGIATEVWLESANAAIAAIRETGAEQLILVPGNGYSSAQRWNNDSYGSANGSVMLSIVDPSDNYAYEVHQYFDRDSSGTSPLCISSTIGSERLAEFTQWLQQHQKRGFLGEFGASQNPQCLQALDNVLAFIEQSSSVWLGWTVWAAGPRWGEYMFSLQPDEQCNDKPQMAIIERYLN
jgi:endoglucanase